MGNFLRTKSTAIVDPRGKTTTLKGVNLGGWLLMEAYILHAPNIAEQRFKKEFKSALGERTLREFERSFRENFIREDDIRTIAGLGFNCLRVPFNHRLVETRPFQYDPQGVAYLDRVIRWARKYRLWVILDLHAAAGAQNKDWHSDSLGSAELWTKEHNRRRTYALWEFLADRYKNNPALAGYDLLNEAVLFDAKLLNEFYATLVRVIRRVDRNHIIFVEGNHWAQDLECLDAFEDDNLALSIHCYAPLEFTHQYIPQLSYPLKNGKTVFNKSSLKTLMARYARTAQKRSCPVLAGEFGVNNRAGLCGEDVWLKDILECFHEFNFHWTYWTYKAVKSPVCPDGIFSYFPNDPWVNRQGPIQGWDTYKDHWLTREKDMVRSWRTDRFTVNEKILKILRDDLSR